MALDGGVKGKLNIRSKGLLIVRCDSGVLVNLEK